MLDRLIEILRQQEKIAIGYSGGVDSSLVMAAAVRALGAESVLAVTADSQTMPRAELDAARRLAEDIGAAHLVIETREMDCVEFTANNPDRCFHCKDELWRQVRAVADERGIRNIADGVNSDDLGDHRPGIRASDEAGVLHPLALIGAGKADVRSMARAINLSNWDKPAQACLSSRFPYGQKITPDGLKRVEQAEEYLRGLGFDQLRVRSHGEIARIEVPADSLARIVSTDIRNRISRRFKELGFTYASLDLEGFRSGSMNEGLSDPGSRE